jgi:hypothetical protein
LKPCPEGKERDSITRRCRKVKSGRPCPPGKVRNETTRRCRKEKVN